MRVGVNSGPVVTGAIGAGERVEFGAMGDSVNVAARLQSEAQPGSVLVGEATRQIVGDRFTWDDGATFRLKGKVDPVTAFTVTGAGGLAAGGRGLVDPHDRQGSRARQGPRSDRRRRLGRGRRRVRQR